jgi:sulfotransferase
MEFFALSGLPRTGSTLLSSILSQNPNIHAEGQSAVCQLMWDMHESLQTDLCKNVLLANNRADTAHSLMSSVFKTYYKNVKAKYVLDKSRSWTLPENVQMLKKYITKNPKIIVMVRPIEEIVQSFVEIRKLNGWKENFEIGLWEPNTEPLTRPLLGVEYAKKNNSGEYFFVEYNDLVDNPKETIEKIYNFCEWEPFNHTFTNIKNINPENDEVWGFKGLHEVRPEIRRRKWHTTMLMQPV